MQIYVYEKSTGQLLYSEQAVGYDANNIYMSNGKISIDESGTDIEFSLLPDLSQTLRADWRISHPDNAERLRELESILAELLFGGER